MEINGGIALSEWKQLWKTKKIYKYKSFQMVFNVVSRKPFKNDDVGNSFFFFFFPSSCPSPLQSANIIILASVASLGWTFFFPAKDEEFCYFS
jgi:hypothetical protein